MVFRMHLTIQIVAPSGMDVDIRTIPLPTDKKFLKHVVLNLPQCKIILQRAKGGMEFVEYLWAKRDLFLQIKQS